MANGGAAEWDDAERQIASGKSTTVSVKSKREGDASTKRKAGAALEEAQKEAEASRERKKSKKGGKRH